MNPVTSTARDGRSVRWDRHRAERRLELVRAARSAVHALGAHASMEEIASHAGTSKTVYYRYFGDREGLRLAVSERVTAHMERRLLEVADDLLDTSGTTLSLKNHRDHENLEDGDL